MSLATRPNRWEVARRILRPEQRDVFALLGYEPEPKQREFHEAMEFDVLYGGAAGGGKSKALVMHALRAADWYPGIRIGIFRRSFPELSESIIPELASVGFAEALGAKWNESKHELRFPNGSLLRLRYIESLTDASRIQGGEYQLLLIDERTLITPQAVDQLKERLRTRVGSGVPVLGIRSTSNPGGADHAAVKKRYIDATDYGAKVYTDEYGQTVRFIPARVDDNRHVDPGYRRRLEAIPDPARRKAMLDGSWDVFSGQVFTEWNRERHVVAPWALPQSWDRYMAVDWGYTKPWAAIWAAEDEDGRLWVYRELYETQVGEHEQARRILAAEDASEQPWRVGDPAMFAKRGDAEAISTAYAEEGVTLDPANNERIGGWQRIHSYLGEAPACPHHRAHGLQTCPKLHIFASCANLIRTLPALPYDTRKSEDVDTNAEDHAPDALRYLVMAVGSGAEFVFPQDPVMTALDGSRLQRDFGPFALPLEDVAPWLR